MQLSVIGTGYLGATQAVCLASWGHNVGVGAAVDPDTRAAAGWRVRALGRGSG